MMLICAADINWAEKCETALVFDPMTCQFVNHMKTPENQAALLGVGLGGM
jgi:hypothetical protein